MMELLKYANGNLPQTEQERQKMIEQAAEHYADFMKALKFDFKSDPNSADTPRRVAKAWVNDLITGCYSPPPDITSFDNTDGYDGMVCQNNIKVVSMCSHHHLQFTGRAHVAYIPSKDGKVIGLSKLNRIVDWFARRPQVQEALTSQIFDYVDVVCEKNKGVAVMIEANHTCCSNRGIKHDSTMRTARVSGAFHDEGGASRAEFYKFIEFAQTRY
jgi:GTP cyclohydrolase I